MPNYDLDRLGDKEFERLSQSLIKEIIGSGTITFGEGRDGGREATFHGKAPYPSTTEQWNGEWIFQAKFHNVKLIGADVARRQLLDDLKSELDKIVNKYSRKCNNYILITNVPLTSVSERGTHDRIAKEIVPDFLKKIPHIHVWGADDLFRFLEKYSDIRRSYLHFITPGDLIAELMDRNARSKSRLAETIQLYLRTSFNREQYAQLDQAGEVGEDRMLLQKVFIDLDAAPRYTERERPIFELPQWLRREILANKPISAMTVLLSEASLKTTLIGGPGQGKSTLGQYLAQIHRATLLDCMYKLNGSRKLMPLVARIPYRIILKEYAQWLLETKDNDNIEFYLAHLVTRMAGRDISADEIQDIIKNNPGLLILDGLDEVTERALRIRMLDRITEFLARSEDILKADIQVVATSRPTGYSDQFDPTRFFHLNLVTISPEKVLEYVDKWVQAKVLEEQKANQLKNSIKECSEDRQVQLLMNTPLQVTILILIILSGGTPPKQREALFDEYLEVIYKREKTKAKWIIRTEKPLLFGLHRYLGYILHSRATGEQNVLSTLKEEAFISEVQSFLKFKDPFSPIEHLNEQVNLIVEEARGRLVLIVELVNGDFGFELRSLQEFFAAGHLSDTAKTSKQRYERFEAIARSSHWRNVALFFAGRVGRLHEGEAANILEVCKHIDRQQPDIFLRRGAWLALDLVADRSFGPNRRLQRSMIEYSLSLLDTDIADRQTRQIISILERIPQEDVRDHLQPVLEHRLRYVQRPVLDPHLSIYYSLFGCTNLLLEILDPYLQSSNLGDVVWSIEKAIDYQAPPKWISKKIEHILPTLSLETFCKIFASRFLQQPSYMKECFDPLDLDDQTIRALLEAILTEPAILNTSHDGKLIKYEWKIEDSNDQLWLFLMLITFLNAFAEDFSYQTRRFRYSSTSTHFDLGFANMRHLTELSQRIEHYFPALADHDSILALLEREELLPELKAVLQAMTITISSEDPKILYQFTKYYSSIKDTQPSAASFLSRYIRQLHPTIYKLLEVLNNQPFASSLNEITSIIDIISQLRVFWIDENSIRLNEAIRESGQKSVEYIAKITKFRREDLEAPPERLQDFENRTGIPLDFILTPSTLDFFGSDHIRLSASETFNILQRIEQAIKTENNSLNALSIARSLVSVDWSIDESTFQKLKELSDNIALHSELNPPKLINLAAILCSKLLNLSKVPEIALLPLLRLIGHNDMSAEMFIVRSYTQSYLNRILTQLKVYLSFSEPEVQHGAIKFASALISELMTETYYEFSSHRDETIFQRSYFDWKLAYKLIKESSSERRIDGVRLLSLSNFKIGKNGSDILEAMRECQDPKEANAWAFFVLLAQPGNSAKATLSWMSFLALILSEGQKFQPRIRQATLEKYDQLIRNQGPGIRIDEEYLNLPLNIEALGQ